LKGIGKKRKGNSEEEQGGKASNQHSRFRPAAPGKLRTLSTHPLPVPDLFPCLLFPTPRHNILIKRLLPSLPLFGLDLFLLLVSFDHARCEGGFEEGRVVGMEGGEESGWYLLVGDGVGVRHG